MAKLGDIALKIRSKNAGPFWLTIDIFAGTKPAYAQINAELSTLKVAHIFKTNEANLMRYALPELKVIKFSLPRPKPQGSLYDSDMHGASWAALFAMIELGEPA